MDSCYCEKCNKTQSPDNFYSSNDLGKYPNEGKLNLCKKCLTMHVDNWNPDTYLWILKECDVPYVPEEWNKLLLKYGQNKAKVTGVTILGRYLSKMRLNQWKDFRWKDNEFLQEQQNHKIEETMKRQGYDAAEIASAIQRGTVGIPVEPPDQPSFDENDRDSATDYFAQMSGGEQDDFDQDLTDEERTYLRLKWGKAYRPEEWIRLEQLYEEMMGSYDIQTAGHIDTLKLMCKTSLKANQLLDIGDVDGAQKMLKMYDSLMKSGKFQAAQNKAESGEFVDSIAELVAICETDGFIPRYYTDGPQDKVDRVLQDMQGYTRTLVTEEMNLGALIERAVKQIEEDREREAQGDSEAADDDEIMENALFADNATSVITDGDIAEFREIEEEWAEEDEELMRAILEDGDE